MTHSAGSVSLDSPSRAWSVLDYIEWIWHVEYVRDLCDSTATAMAAFGSFRRSTSAERGRGVAL